ncbi:Sec1-like protein [Irpex lacteus]|nr:Sec1-like protein [Irpex lacteus]
MDVVKAVETYITKMVSTPNAMKVLLLDTHTTPIVSLASTQSTLLSHQVYLTDRIDNKKRERMAHMKCVCFLQPSDDSLEALETELKEPKYGEYYLYFSNILSKTSIERLADVDEYEVVREVQEYFADYAPILPSLFSLNYAPSKSRPLYGSSPNTWDPAALDRSVQGLIAVLLSLKKKPVIRYEKSSPMAKKLGVEVQHRIQTESSLFDFRGTQVPPLLLILDRRNDPVTPLLSQWTYQAMVHELLGIQNGRVDLSLVPDIRPELKEITLTPSTDPFFQAHHLATFGDLGTSLKSYVQSYQSHSLANNPSSINSISDMKRFLGGNVSKHVALVGELSRLVDRDKLLEIGEVEQGLATGSGADLKSVQAVITNPAVPAWNKLRVVMLYAIRYQKSQANSVASLINLALENGVSREDARLVYVILNIAGSDQRQEDLFSAETLLAKGRSALKGLKGVENVYMQHTPHLSQTLENLLRGRLRDTNFPFLDDVIVFMVGGTTYEEARTVSLLNQESASSGSYAPGTRILLGGTYVHNSSSFVEMIRQASTNWPSSVFEPPPESANNMPSLNLNLGGVNTMEDVKVKTRTGAFLTLISAALILAITTMEFFDYRRVTMDTSIQVDKSRGEKLTVKINLTFPRVPCYLLSLDVMDISGETQSDITHHYETSVQNDIDKINEQRQNGYCGSCYGGLEPEGGCCNTCEDVRQAYVNRGWSFNNPDAIEQVLRARGWSEKLHEQAHEGCNIAGIVRVNKVVGNIHFSPGRSFRTAAQNIYELVPYLKEDGNRHDFSHTIQTFAFEGDDEFDFDKAKRGLELKKSLGVINPLDGTSLKTSKAQYMFQYFLKVVSTQFRTLDGKVINTHQYSATHFERAFFNYEISPILIVHQETRQSFAHFLTSTCAIVGGVLTVASLIDSALFATSKHLKKAGASSYTNGKLM